MFGLHFSQHSWEQKGGISMHAQQAQCQKTVIVAPAEEPAHEPQDILAFVMTKPQYGNYRRKCWERDPHCVYCRKKIAWKSTTFDHILPRAQGGLDAPYNLVLSCESCNSTKAARTALEWARDILQAVPETTVEVGGVA